MTGAQRNFQTALRRVFDKWLAHGSSVLNNKISFEKQAPAVPVTSLQHYISLLFAQDMPMRLRSAMTLDQVIHIRVETDELVLDVRDMTEEVLCKEMLPRLNWAADFEEDEDRPTEEQREALLRSHPFQDEICQILMSDLLAKYGKKTVFEIFEEKRQKSGFFRWWTGASYDGGSKQKDRFIETDSGLVTIRVRRYSNQPSDLVTAYQWEAYLGQTPEEGLPDAVACGMLYKCLRMRGETMADAEEVLRSSDAVADSDVLQVRAFLDQNEDADELVKIGDLCFVWIWERREATPRGAGIALLKTAIRNLVSRFRCLGIVVIEACPYQFVEADGRYPEPPEVQLMRLDAIDKLQELITQLESELEDLGLLFRTIVEEKVDSSFFAALHAIGKRE